ncbi:hypothetical protein P280DRAFT_522210 [Massarina eburnea CBS 473.64]|uniref:EKC/KEOPS complex subunit BUD32 n=1 Tax=Massarina eburnea CBS 473.64 TaxID=1395130 RepID=A0A6A6RL00_9PLEO|nr:hypothetical protein P280DRAFT_522210 [Massarina eburnea CBS 473.64]
MSIDSATYRNIPKTPLLITDFFPLYNASCCMTLAPIQNIETFLDIFIKKYHILAEEYTVYKGESEPRKPRRTLQLLKQEIMMAARLRKYPHENICAYLGCITTTSAKNIRRVIALAYEKYSIDLYAYISQGNPRLSVSQAQEVVEDVYSRMRHLHSIGIVHCDLCPSNIFLRLQALSL